MKIEARNQRMNLYTFPEHALPLWFGRLVVPTLSMDEIHSEMLKPPSSKLSERIIPSSIGIDDISRWVEHGYFTSVDVEYCVLFCVLIPRRAGRNQNEGLYCYC